MLGEARPGMLTAMLTFDLPLFTRDRQDRELAAARSMQRGAEARREDAAREFEALLGTVYVRARSLRAARDLYRSDMLTVARAAVEAALASYRSGEGSLAEVVGAERRLLDLSDKERRLGADLGSAIAELEALTGELP
jgi:outer membrane protein TolC